MKRVRDRRNKHGRRGGGNRCGHDRRRFIRPRFKDSIPQFLRIAIERLRGIALPLVESTLPFRFPHAPRSERAEAIRAVGAVALGRTDIVSGRIGRPSKRDRRRFNGLSIDHDLAPLAEVSESRTERTISTYEDLGWLHWTAAPAGGRKTKRGFLRKASQPVERKDGRFRGRAAVRVWTPKFWDDLGLTAALAEAVLKRAQSAAMDDANKRVPVAPLVAQLVDALTLPDPDARPPP